MEVFKSADGGTVAAVKSVAVGGPADAIGKMRVGDLVLSIGRRETKHMQDLAEVQARARPSARRLQPPFLSQGLAARQRRRDRARAPRGLGSRSAPRGRAQRRPGGAFRTGPRRR